MLICSMNFTLKYLLRRVEFWYREKCKINMIRNNN